MDSRNQPNTDFLLIQTRSADARKIVLLKYICLYIINLQIDVFFRFFEEDSIFF